MTGKSEGPLKAWLLIDESTNQQCLFENPKQAEPYEHSLTSLHEINILTDQQLAEREEKLRAIILDEHKFGIALLKKRIKDLEQEQANHSDALTVIYLKGASDAQDKFKQEREEIARGAYMQGMKSESWLRDPLHPYKSSQEMFNNYWQQKQKERNG